jgi:hypothetical protein
MAATLSTLSPLSTQTNIADFVLTVNGTGFINGSTIVVDGTDLVTTFVSSTQLTGVFTNALTLSPGQAFVSVRNPDLSVSNELTVSVLAAIAPNIVTTSFPTAGIGYVYSQTLGVVGGLGPFTWTIISGTIPPGVAHTNGELFGTPTTAGTYSFTVRVQDAQGFVDTQALSITVEGAAIGSLSPTAAPEGGGTFTLTVNGTGFTAASIVRLNGSNRTTTFVSPTRLTAVIPNTDITTGGTRNITVATGSHVSAGVILAVNQAPVATALSPSTSAVGGAQINVVMNGDWFQNGAVVYFNGQAMVTTYLSVNQVRGRLTAAMQTATGVFEMIAINPDGQRTTAQLYTVTGANNPVPTLTTVSPNSASTGDSDVTVTLTGTNFVNSSVMRVNGVARPTTYVSSTQLTATVPASDLLTAASLSITVYTETPGGGATSAQTFTVNLAANPVPAISSISPLSKSVNSAAFTLTVNGSNFIAGSVVRVNGSDRATTFVSANQLTAQVLAGDLLAAGSLSITVNNPANATGGGGNSAQRLFTVNAVLNPDPSIGSVVPFSALVGSPATAIVVTGSGFVSGSKIRVNGEDRTTTFISATQLQTTLTVTDLASARNLGISVWTPTPGGGVSSSLNFIVSTTALTLPVLTPNIQPIKRTIRATQGSSVRFPVDLNNGLLPFNLAGCTGRMQARNGIADVHKTVLLDLTTENGGIVVDPVVNGRVWIEIQEEVTAMFTWNYARFELTMKTLTDDVVPIVKGDLRVTRRVTELA